MIILEFLAMVLYLALCYSLGYLLGIFISYAIALYLAEQETAHV